MNTNGGGKGRFVQHDLSWEPTLTNRRNRIGDWYCLSSGKATKRKKIRRGSQKKTSCMNTTQQQTSNLNLSLSGLGLAQRISSRTTTIQSRDDLLTLSRIQMVLQKSANRMQVSEAKQNLNHKSAVERALQMKMTAKRISGFHQLTSHGKTMLRSCRQLSGTEETSSSMLSSSGRTERRRKWISKRHIRNVR